MNNEILKTKNLYKLDLFLLKLLPAIMAISHLIATYGATIQANEGIILTIQIISHYLGLVIAPVAFIFISSYVFQFCNYHRMFMYYIITIDLMNVTNWYFHIPISNELYMKIQNIITIVFLSITLIMYIKKRKQIKLCKKPEPSD